ncbi:hypothetical protein LSAT2_025509, partial [Lamellibrachia satsuma]
YIFFLSALFVMVSGFVSYYFNTELDKWLRWTAMDIIRNRYRGRYSFEWPSLVINYMMAKGFCCGVKSFRDFEKAKRWKRMYKVDGKTRKLPIPLSCCRVDDHFPRGIPRDVECTKTPTKTNSFIQDGCSRWIGDVASEYEGTVKYWTIGILLLLGSHLFGEGAVAGIPLLGGGYNLIALARLKLPTNFAFRLLFRPIPNNP